MHRIFRYSIAILFFAVLAADSALLVTGDLTFNRGYATSSSSKSKTSEMGGMSVVKPLGSGEPIDYYNSATIRAQSVQQNLTQEYELLQPGQCQQRILPPHSTTAIPFTYDNRYSNINVAAGGVTRLFISSVPGYDPLNRLAPSVQNDFASPCHAQANLPGSDPHNQNSLSLTEAGASGQQGCMLRRGETYYLNIQNQGKAPLCASFGSDTACGSCE